MNSASDFDKAVLIILESEGGYVNHPNDPGGETKYGITKQVAMNHGYIGDMSQLPINTAAVIYKEDYWDACKCDQISWPLNLYVFDAAVNQGVSAATTMLQTVLHTLPDGVFGKVTLGLVSKATPQTAIAYLSARSVRYFVTRNFDKFGQGWLNRLFKIARYV